MGATAIKQSLEDEGSSYEDIKNMQKICKKVGMPLNLKIGGCEAINDINFCRLISSNNIIAPMVETKYAFEKFMKNFNYADRNQKFFVNLETIDAFNNIKKILDIFNNNKLFLSINTVSEVKDFLYLKNTPLNFNPKKAPNSQNLPKIVKLNFAVNIIERELMLKNKSIISDKPYLYKIDAIEGLDIDTLFDFNYAKLLHKKLF